MLERGLGRRGVPDEDMDQPGARGLRRSKDPYVGIVDGDPGSFRSVDATLARRRGDGAGLSDILAQIA